MLIHVARSTTIEKIAQLREGSQLSINGSAGNCFIRLHVLLQIIGNRFIRLHVDNWQIVDQQEIDYPVTCHTIFVFREPVTQGHDWLISTNSRSAGSKIFRLYL